jgi:hypothetical protein
MSGRGRVVDYGKDWRLSANGGGKNGQGQVLNPHSDSRLAKNRSEPNGGGRVKNAGADGRLLRNRVRNAFIRKLALSDEFIRSNHLPDDGPLPIGIGQEVIGQTYRFQNAKDN